MKARLKRILLEFLSITIQAGGTSTIQSVSFFKNGLNINNH
jgi:hypothetical protein